MLGNSLNGVKNNVLFIRKFAASPRTVGSITPSSSYLTSSMLKNVRWDEVNTIVELGAGTGVFTRAIICRMKKGTRLFVFEIEPEMRAHLESMTGLEIYSDATTMHNVLAKGNISKADLIVSSLPYAVLPRGITEQVVGAVKETISLSGMFVAFQFSLHMKGRFKQVFSDVTTRFVPLNIPPAFVYECRKPKGGYN